MMPKRKKEIKNILSKLGLFRNLTLAYFGLNQDEMRNKFLFIRDGYLFSLRGTLCYLYPANETVMGEFITITTNR